MPAIRKSVQSARLASGHFKLRDSATGGPDYSTVVVAPPGTAKETSPQVGSGPMFGRLAGRIIIADDFDTWPDEMLEAMEGSHP